MHAVHICQGDCSSPGTRLGGCIYCCSGSPFHFFWVDWQLFSYRDLPQTPVNKPACHHIVIKVHVCFAACLLLGISSRHHAHPHMKQSDRNSSLHGSLSTAQRLCLRSQTPFSQGHAQLAPSTTYKQASTLVCTVMLHLTPFVRMQPAGSCRSIAVAENGACQRHTMEQVCTACGSN